MKKLFLLLYLLISTQIISAFTGSGSGTSGDPYLVSTAAELNDVRNGLTAYYKQTSDINLGSYSNWERIGSDNSTYAFIGTYDGDYHKITGLKITSTTFNFNGLFGVVGDNASHSGTVKNLGVIEASVIGSHAGLGILIGYVFNGTVQNCYSTGSVSSSASGVGGLAGQFYYGTIQSCYSNATVTETNNSYINVGGLIGYMLAGSQTLQNCYATGSVSGSNRVGGLVGSMASTATIAYCYSTGVVTNSTGGGGLLGYIISSPTTITNCYWDTETSNQINSAGGTGKTTAEMKTQSTFTEWDFTTIWEIIPGFYPRLKNNSDPALPVELTLFTANITDKKVTLNWQTSTEVNNYGFEVERTKKLGDRSQNDWESIGFVAGSGNSNSIKFYSFNDLSLNLNPTLKYRLKQIDNDGSFTYSKEVEIINQNIPTEFSLEQNYPNPFNPVTTIRYSVPSTGTSFLSASGGMKFTQLKVYNILGNEVATLVNENQQAGEYEVKFNASDLASGIYLYQLQIGDFTAMKKLVILK